MKLSKTSSQKIVIYLVPVVVIMLLTLLTFMFLVPKIKETYTNFKLLDDRKAQLLKLQKKRSLLDSANANVTKQLLILAEQALPAEKDVPSILVSLENQSAATLFGIDKVTLSPGGVSSASAEPLSVKAKSAQSEQVISHKGAQVLEVAVSGKGTTAQLLAFIKSMQGSRRLFDIKTLAFSYTVETPDFLTVNFNLLAYYLPPIREISQIDEDLPQITQLEQKTLENLNKLPYISNVFTTDVGVSSTVQIKRVDLFSE